MTAGWSTCTYLYDLYRPDSSLPKPILANPLGNVQRSPLGSILTTGACQPIQSWTAGLAIATITVQTLGAGVGFLRAMHRV